MTILDSSETAHFLRDTSEGARVVAFA